MPFINIHAYLERFKNFKLQDSDLKKGIVEIFLKELHISIAEENISVSKNRIFIRESSVVKNEILFKKQLILEKLKEKTGNSNFDIS